MQPLVQRCTHVCVDGVYCHVSLYVVVQFPLLDLIGFISTRVYTYGFVVSVVIIYSLTIICGLYPSRMATRIHPAAALHYE